VAVEPIEWSKATAAQKILESMLAKIPSTEAKKAPIDFLMVAGDGRDDEVIFRWANDLGESKFVRYVTTVSLGSRDTQAMKTLTQGVTGELFSLSYLELPNHMES
jgi:trehalose 6-phosphate synthase complex regulatory subunit